MKTTLVTIALSHYCEKARWALERAAVPFREEAYVPFTHLAGTLRRGGRSTPLLVLPDGAVLKDSTDILAYADERAPGAIYPTEPASRREVEALEDRFDEGLGPHARRIAYHALLTSGRSFAPAIRAAGSFHRPLAPALALVVPHVVKRALRVDAKGAEISQGKVDRVLDEVEAMLADGRRYLVGDRFSAADLTFAALYAPLVNPPEQPVTSRVEPPPSYAAMCEANRLRPAGAFAMRLYREERTSVAPVQSLPSIDSASASRLQPAT